MILIEATIKYSNINPDTLKLHSNKRICVSCNDCGRVRWVQKNLYRDLCKSCAALSRLPMSDKTKMKIGLGNKDKIISKQSRKNMSNVHISKNLGKNNPSWKGGKITKKCDYCGKSKNVFPGNKYNYNFCNNECRGKWQSENLIGKDHPAWLGGFDKTQPHLIPINKCYCLNERFINSEGHHLNKDTVIFIPYNLHHHIYHNMKTGQGMNEINMLSLQFIRGEL